MTVGFWKCAFCQAVWMSPLTSQDERLKFETMRKWGRWSETAGWVQFICVCVLFSCLCMRYLSCTPALCPLHVLVWHNFTWHQSKHEEIVSSLQAQWSWLEICHNLHLFFVCSRFSGFFPFAFQAVTVVLDANKYSFVFVGTVFLFQTHAPMLTIQGGNVWSRLCQCSHRVEDVRRHHCGLVSIHRLGSDPDVMKRLLVGEREAEGTTGRLKKWRVSQRTWGTRTERKWSYIFNSSKCKKHISPP